MKQFLLISFVKFLSKFPLSWMQRLGGAIGFTFNLIPNKVRRVCRINISLCFPELDNKQQRELVKSSLIEIGKTIMEMPALWFWPIDKVLNLIVHVEGEELIKQAFKQGRGMILLSPHMGSWEILNYYLAKRYSISVLYKPTKQTYLQPLIHNARQRTGSKFVPTNNSGVKSLYHALDQNEAIIILPDHDPGKGGVFAPFFNRPTFTMTLVNRLMQRKQPPAFYMYAERISGGGGFNVYFKPANSADLGNSDQVVAATELNRGIEQCIRANPSQYLWSYRRFKKTPVGFDKVY